jgi:chromate transporter
MTEAATQEQSVERPVSLAALFIAFLAVSLCGVGGGSIVWARRIAVDKRRWISDREFADIVSLCQFMPGPNIVGIAVCVGAKMRGAIGTIAALCGFLVIPWVVGFSLGVLCLNMLTWRFSGTSSVGLLRRRPGFSSQPA